MSMASPKKKNAYLDKINESLLAFFRTSDKFNQNLNELSQLANGATVHINDIERILGSTDNDNDDDEDGNEADEVQPSNDGDERESIVAEKICELNDSLNTSVREIRQSWSTLEKQGAAIAKSVCQLPKLIRLFLDSTKTDVEFNDSSSRSEMDHLSEQLAIIGQFYYELCLEIQVLFLDLSSMKAIKHLATALEFSSSRSMSIAVPLQIVRQIQILFKHWRALAVASAAWTSSYLLVPQEQSSQSNRFLSLFKVTAAEYERRNAGAAFSRHRHNEKRKSLIYDDDDDDDDESETEAESVEDNVSNVREKRFRDFASVEYNGEIYMTPVDFLESVVAERPRPRIGRRELSDEVVESILYSTPPKHRGSKRFFRNLEDAGLISFSEYLFLWVILTKPHTQFEIAFAMFDTDGNQLVDKREFLVLGKVMSDKRMLRRQSSTDVANKSLHIHPNLDSEEQMDTTLLLHFFGKNGRDTLNYTEFHRFMENLQTEVLEIEFTEFSHGFKTISDLDFAELLLRYTDFDRDTKKTILKKVKKTTNQPNGITFEQFEHFFAFLNNLEEFSIAMRFHQLSNKPISQAEFQRAVKISTGFELDGNIIGLIFRIFDADDDQHLSYDEFMAVMKDRLSRGFQTSDVTDSSLTKFEQFKRCFRERAKYESSAA